MNSINFKFISFIIISILLLCKCDNDTNTTEEYYSKICSELKTKNECMLAGLNKAYVNLSISEQYTEMFKKRLLHPLSNGRCCWQITNNSKYYLLLIYNMFI